MDPHEIPEDRDLTDEEVATLEKELLEAVRGLFHVTQNLSNSVAEAEPELAERLNAAAAKLLLNVEAATSLDGGPGSMSTH